MAISPYKWAILAAISVMFMSCSIGIMWLFRYGPKKYGKTGTALLAGSLGGLIAALPLWAMNSFFSTEWRVQHFLGPICIAIPVSIVLVIVMRVHISAFNTASDTFWKWMHKTSNARGQIEEKDNSNQPREAK